MIDKNNLAIKISVENIIENIVSSRHGEIYDEEIGKIYVNEYFEETLQLIFEEVDKTMIEKYTEEDNLTII